MRKDKQETPNGLPEIGVGLGELVRCGARQVIRQAIEAELTDLLTQYVNVQTLTDRQALVRNGYLPERDIVTAAGPLMIKVPKVRDRSGTGVKFNSSIVRPYVRKSPRIGCAALVVLERHFDRRHGRCTVGTAGRGGKGLVGKHGVAARGTVGRRMEAVGQVRSICCALDLLVGRWHPYRC